MEAAVRTCCSTQVILTICQYSQENSVMESLFKKVALKFFIKKRLQHRYFPVTNAKFLRTAFVIEHQWLFSIWPYYILWMIYELITFSVYTMSYGHVSTVTDLQLWINQYKKENDKQKCLLMIFFNFCSWKCSSRKRSSVYFTHVVVVLQILWFLLSLPINCITSVWITRKKSWLDQVS